jgi:hypothetical protein
MARRWCIGVVAIGTLIGAGAVSAQIKDLTKDVTEDVTQDASKRAKDVANDTAHGYMDGAEGAARKFLSNPLGAVRDMTKPSEEDVSAAPPSGAARPSSGALWSVAIDGKVSEGLPAPEVGRLIAAGKVTKSTLVWNEQMTDWTPAGQVPELTSAFPKSPPPLPKRSPPPLPPQ